MTRCVVPATTTAHARFTTETERCLRAEALHGGLLIAVVREQMLIPVMSAAS